MTPALAGVMRSGQPPAQCFTGMERHDFADPVGYDGLAALQRDRSGVERQAIEIGAMLAGEPLELFERAVLIEGGDIGFERIGRVENARSAAGGFLGVHCVRRAVGTEEKARIAGSSSAQQSRAVRFAF